MGKICAPEKLGAPQRFCAPGAQFVQAYLQKAEIRYCGIQRDAPIIDRKICFSKITMILVILQVFS